MMAQL
jgi:hypothetical protein